MSNNTTFRVHYRNHLGGKREASFEVNDHNEARNETLAMYGDTIDDSPCRIERIAAFGEHTHTWTSDNIWDSCLRLQWVVGPDREQRRYRKYSNRSGDRG